MKKALIVIDVQNCFAVEKAADLPSKIAKHIQNISYDHVLFTVFRNESSSNFHKILNWKGAMNRPGIDIHPELASFLNGQNTFEKTTYSALKSKTLLDFLKKENITDLFLCGINTDACVLATAFEAFDFGFTFTILEELCSISSFKEEYENAAEVIIKRNLK